MEEKIYCVYILLCSDKSYYIGVTSELDNRLWQHQTGYFVNCYTYDKRPVELKYFEETNNVWDALCREKQLKGWSRKKKKALIKGTYLNLIKYSKRRGGQDL